MADTIAAVLEREPDWQALPDETPARIRELLRQCLEKDARPASAEYRGRPENNRAGTARMEPLASRCDCGSGAGDAGHRRCRLVARPGSPPDRSEWVQITKLPDSVSQPALSPDGRMVAFVRGPETFFGPGQIYVKTLPDGEPVQLTHDSFDKMSPVFSPDGARIAYTTVNAQFDWDTWVVPVLGGEPQQWLRNASGLVWTGPRQVLFSEMKKSSAHGDRRGRGEPDRTA